ncbi:MAG: transcription elongation factor GreA [Alphaproteobacteria bacterium]|nr:transcription elongation factor GreA [Alphaproteobacteria bacterium]
MDKIPITTEGYTQLDAELKRLRSIERPKIIQAIAEARAHGDLSENAEYHAAKEAQSLNEARVAELEETLGRAEVIEISKLSGERITFGASVTLIDDDTEEEKNYRIVGEYEASVKEGKISINSPIARSLIGKKKGGTVDVNTPGGGKSYQIIEVKFS